MCLNMAPTGGTLLKRRHLELQGHVLVIVPYWEWEGCKKGGREAAVPEGQACTLCTSRPRAHEQSS